MEKNDPAFLSFVTIYRTTFFFGILFYFLYSRFLLAIYFIHISVCQSPSPSSSPPPLPPLSPLGVHTFVLYICVSTSALQTRTEPHLKKHEEKQIKKSSFWLAFPQHFILLLLCSFLVQPHSQLLHCSGGTGDRTSGKHSTY